jgi:hypothetical protein
MMKTYLKIKPLRPYILRFIYIILFVPIISFACSSKGLIKINHKSKRGVLFEGEKGFKAPLTQEQIQKFNIPTLQVPPPPPSAIFSLNKKDCDLPNNDQSNITFGKVNSKLRKALMDNGYSDLNYYYIKGGFAIATKMEQIEENLFSKPQRYRWTEKNISPLSWDKNVITDYLIEITKRAITNRARFRQFIFLVHPFTYPLPKDQSKYPKIDDWLNQGPTNRLPHLIADKKTTKHHECDVYIYEFIKSMGKTEFVPNGSNGEMHIKNSGIYRSLM